MKFDFKVTLWNSITTDDKNAEKELLSLIKSGSITTAGDAFDWLNENSTTEPKIENLYDTEYTLTPREDNGATTIEVIEEDEHGSIIVLFSNGYGDNPEEQRELEIKRAYELVKEANEILSSINRRQDENGQN